LFTSTGRDRKKVFPKGFLAILPQRRKILKEIFTRRLYADIYAKLHNFIKHDHLKKFYISLEKFSADNAK